MARKDKEADREYQARYYREHKDEKKRTTSTAVKNRYNKKTYTQISVSVKKDIAERYKAKCKADGITISEPLHKAINAYIGEDCVEEDSEE
ncbi:MAG: hypothetical protein II453_09765 [Alphaproteobacteria bacterium]|nr:hypothetical protein [Alphaproteobacteria bacterium]MBQ3946551.1 hypothetical protein [Alphaproteobacteria bacterium]